MWLICIWIKSLFQLFFCTYIVFKISSFLTFLSTRPCTWFLRGRHTVKELAGPCITKPLHTTVYLYYTSNYFIQIIFMKIHQRKFKLWITKEIFYLLYEIARDIMFFFPLSQLLCCLIRVYISYLIFLDLFSSSDPKGHVRYSLHFVFHL